MAITIDNEGVSDALVILGAAGLVIPAFSALRISPVVGFILVGIAVGPHALGAFPALSAFTISDADVLEPAAEIGVAMLLFALGLELSLDLLEALCLDPVLAGWNGVGFVVQAYQKRAPFVLDWIIDLARRSGRRVMVRLVKGAYKEPPNVAYPVKADVDENYYALAQSMLGTESRAAGSRAVFGTHDVALIARIRQLHVRR